MKKLFALLLALCALCGTALAAEPLRVLDDWFAADRYEKHYPERALERIEPLYDETGEGNQDELLFAGEWDAAVIETNGTDLSALCAEIPLLDLTDIAPEKGGTMYPAVKRALTCEGKLIGLPMHIFGCTMSLEFSDELLARLGLADAEKPETLRGLSYRAKISLGLADAEKPETFAELAGLAERYMALPAQTRRGTAFDADVRDGWLRYYLSYMIRCYQAQCADANGETDFDTPLFRENLAQVERLNAALCADTKILRGKNGELRSLTCANSGLGGEMHVREGDTAVPARMYAVIVNANSPRREEALDYARAAMDEAESEFFYSVVDSDAQLREAYNRLIAAQIEEGEAQSVIDRLEKLRDAGDPLHYYTKEALEAYARDVAPRLTFPHYRWLDDWNAAGDYAAGRLDADALIDRLNRLMEK